MSEKTKSIENNFTSGPIFLPLVRFALPVLLALILQAMYGAVDLMVVGMFADSADVSAVASGSQLMTTLTGVVSGLAVGVTVLLGMQIGQGRSKEGGRAIGSGLFLFLVIGAILTAALVLFAGRLAGLMQAPEEAFSQTASYIRICGGGLLIIIAYNLIGSIFRGLGDSATPLLTVAIACAVNIGGDLLNVAVFHMGAAGAAVATVAAQCVSVLISLILIRRKELPFAFSVNMIRPDGTYIRKIASLGIPIATSELLVGLSFVIIQTIVNALGVTSSAGVGIAEKVCAFIMLVPSAFMQSLSAFVSQNAGAGRFDRVWKTLRIAIALSLAAGILMCLLSWFRGDFLAGIFTKDPDVIEAAAEYLRAYAIDCLLVAFLFCFVGFYNGIGMTRFVMIQGICGAFGVRVPISYLMSLRRPVSIFMIGLATPCSTVVQILLCLVCLGLARRRMRVSLE